MDSQPDPDIQIAGYRIEARVGRGGMGQVYRAVQLNLGRRVALKVLAPELAADSVFRRRFLRESRVAAGIDHPNIIPIYETGEDGELLYIAMRYVEGSDLATLLEREGRLEPPRALAILGQVAAALDAAHARGLVHRDVKPANVLLAGGAPGAAPHCYLCDFGLIKQVSGEQAFSALTATDQFVGTIPYVAPEQIEGRDLDGRADVYSLGCVLFHCLTGAAPFQGDTDVEVVFAHLREPPPSLSARLPGLPRSVDAVVARAMAKAKEDRWPTCSALIAAMDALLRSGSRQPTAAADDETRSMVLPPAAPAPTPHPVTAPLPHPATDPAPPLARPAATPGSARPAGMPHPAPPAGMPASARPGSGPPLGERSRPVREVPAVVHRGGADAPAVIHGSGADAPAVVHGGGGDGRPRGPAVVHRGGRRRGRRWLAGLVLVLVPVVTYLGTVELLGGLRRPEVGASSDQAGVAVSPTARRPPATARPTCRWTRPAVGTPTRTAPLAAIRAEMGWTDRFVVEELRYFTGPDGLKHWYVKAQQETDPSRRGRWLVREDQDGRRRVVAMAAFDTRGYEARDWRVSDGGRLPAGTAACLAGT